MLVETVTTPVIPKHSNEADVKMCTNLIDPEAILSGNEEWTQLEEKWGEPIDLETEEDDPTELRPVFSTLDLMKTTFDSSFLFKKVRRKVGRQLSNGVLDYKEFIQNLEENKPPKDFYYVNGQIFSAISVEEICDRIDDLFKSVEKLSSATSTVRKKLPEVVNCSISVDDLSFDDTMSEKEKTDGDDIEQYIDEAFEKLSHLSSISKADRGAMESVTTLVRKFSSILSNPAVNRSPRRQRQCCNKFRELAEFWNTRAFDRDI